MPENTQLVAMGNGVLAVVEPKGKNYIISSPLTGLSEKLLRNIDFGLIPKTSKPTLYKSGAEKVAMTYGLMQRYSIESKTEDLTGKTGCCFYVVKCELVKGFMQGDGTYKEVVYASGYGSANTSEKRNGFNDVFNSANSTLKMAQKRALVSAALAVSGLSSMFTQDIEDETFMKNADTIINETPESPISQAQIKRLFAICADLGMTTNEAKQKLASLGFTSTKAIKVKDYDEVIKKLKEEN